MSYQPLSPPFSSPGPQRPSSPRASSWQRTWVTWVNAFLLIALVPTIPLVLAHNAQQRTTRTGDLRDPALGLALPPRATAGETVQPSEAMSTPPNGASLAPAAVRAGAATPTPKGTAAAAATPAADQPPIPTPNPTSKPAPTPRPTPVPTAKPTPTPPPPPPPPPPPSTSITRIVVVWMENEEASGVTASSMPYLYGLSNQFGRATKMYGISHPSEPNYLGFWSGSTHGVADDGVYNITAPTLGSQVTAAGKQWRIYAQDVPGNCFTGSSANGGVDGPGVAGTYVRKHEPAISFTAVQNSPTECAKIQPLSAFNPTAFNVAFVVPNLCNDIHDCSLATGDAFLAGFLPQVFNSPDWAHTLLIVTFDEGSSGVNGGGNIFTLVARQGLSGFTSSTTHNHYGVLHTIENVLGLPCLANSCNATPLTEFLP